MERETAPSGQGDIERLRLEREHGRMEAVRRLWRVLIPWLQDSMDFSDGSEDALAAQVVLRIEKTLEVAAAP